MLTGELLSLAARIAEDTGRVPALWEDRGWLVYPESWIVQPARITQAWMSSYPGCTARWVAALLPGHLPGNVCGRLPLAANERRWIFNVVLSGNVVEDGYAWLITRLRLP